MLLQRCQTGFGLGFAAQSQHGVEDRQYQEHDRSGPFTRDHDIDHGRAHQDDLHEVLVLA